MRIVLLVAGVLLVALPAFAQKGGKKVWTDPGLAAQEDPDFQFQGEYVGALDLGDRQEKVGIQVIALGNGKFQTVGFFGGLPGDGGDPSRPIKGEGQREGQVVKVTAREADGLIKDGVLTVFEKGTKRSVGSVKKITRKSPTLGKEPPQGAIVLFDGSTAEKFKGGRLSEDGYLMQGVTSRQTFEGPHLVHVEFLLPYMPNARGQGRANSGLYVQGRHEVQMLDSFGLAGKDNECGGIYEVRDPDVNMCFPPLIWQTYDVEITPAKFDENGKKTSNARLTVSHNGVLVHEDVEVPKATRASPLKEGPGAGPVYLQNHGNPVRYRNIWVLPKKS